MVSKEKSNFKEGKHLNPKKAIIHKKVDVSLKAGSIVSNRMSIQGNFPIIWPNNNYFAKLNNVLGTVLYALHPLSH